MQATASDDCDRVDCHRLQATAIDNQRATTAIRATGKTTTDFDCKRRLHTTTANLVPTTEPTASDDSDDDDDDKRHEQSM